MKGRIFGLVVGLIALGMLLYSPAVKAEAIIDFGLIAPSAAGSISYAVAGGPLSGASLEIDNVVKLLPLPVASYNIIGGVLNFTTGNLTGTTGTTWSFGGGPASSITITGTIDVDNSGTINTGDITGILLSGKFGNASVTAFGSVFKIAGAAFFDEKNEEMLDLFDIPVPPGWEGNFNISFNSNSASPPSTFSSTLILSGDVVNTAVPEPISLILLGSGLVGAGLYRRLGKPRG